MRTVALILSLLMISAVSFSQNQNQGAFQTSFVIAGTSTMHDWTMETQGGEGNAMLHVEDGKLSHISSLKVTIPAESLKSGKGAMDKNAYDALKTDQYPTITFDLTAVEKLKQEDGIIRVECTGDLTIAGTTKKENLVVVCRAEEDGSLSCEGSKDLQMSSYGVEPPTFMFGTIKTGDKITISFDVKFNLDKNVTSIQ